MLSPPPISQTQSLPCSFPLRPTMQILQNKSDSSLFSKLRTKLSPKRPPAPIKITPTIPPKCQQFERLFHRFDENGDGKISPSELQSCLTTLGGELSSREAESVVESMDSDGDGLLGMDDFAKLMGSDDGEEEKMKILKEAFGMYAMQDDASGNCITPKSLKKMLSRLGEPTTIDQCKDIVCRFDLDGDGVISFDEFQIMMR